MPKAKGDEEQKTAAEVMVAEDNAAQSDDKAAKKKPAKAATEKITGAKAAVKKPSKAASDDAESVVPRPRPVVSARPSIYEDITAAAKKLDAERAAKAVNRASTVSQNAKNEQMSSATATPKKAASPFLATNIARAAPSILKPATEAANPITPSAAPASIAPLFPTTQAQSVSEESLTPSPTAAPTPPTAQPKTAVVEPPAKAEPQTLDIEEEVKRMLATPETHAPSITVAKPPPPRARPQRMPAPARPSTHIRPKAGPPTTRTSAPPATPRPIAKPQAAQQRPAPTTAPRPQAKAPARPAAPIAPKPVAPLAPPVPAGPVAIGPIITVRELAPLLRVTVGDMLKKLISLGIFATINQSLDYDTAALIAEEFEIKTKPVEEATLNAEAKPATRVTLNETDQKRGQTRPPVVTILGHVDHGKTSLLDAIRSANVAGGEAGGITQHIGAYQIEKQGHKITFLDTPGHEAFTAMRARGAQVTDVAVLVVAADDGVMPQTKEAISHARAANVPIVVALNKIDRETAEPPRVMSQLADAGVVVEEWGGDVPMVKVSARKMIGIEELLDMILLVSDLAELKANPDRPAIGTVIEAEMDRSRGPVATLLVQNGTIRQNDYLVINTVSGRIRAMFDDRGNRLTDAGPSTPVVVLGLPSVPQAGDTFQVVADERTARTMAGHASESSQAQTRTARTLSLDELYAQMEAGKVHDLNIVLKADVQGSLEPIRNSLEKLSLESLKVRILHQALGNISESDVSLALASKAIVIGFNVEPDAAARRLAAAEGVDIRVYSIIYKLIEDVEKALKGLLEPTYKEVITGHADVRQVFKVNKKNVAGCYITDGKATRTGQARLLRVSKPVFDGRIASLKRFTEDVREVLTNFECGVMLEGFEDIKPGDVIEFYHMEKEE